MYSGKKIKTLDEIPKGTKWLMSKKLQGAYEKLPMNIRRHLSSSAFVATKMYGMKQNRWYDLMIKDANEYQSHRNKNTKSEYEKLHIPKNGMKSIKKATQQYKTQIKRELTKPPTLKGLYKYQLFIALKFMSSDTPVRNDLPTLNIEHEKGNFIKKVKKSYEIVINEYKNSKQLGPRTIKLSRANSIELSKFLKYRADVVDHDFLFSLKNGKAMSKKSFSQALIKLTNELLGKRIGSRLLRVMYATDKKDVLAEASKVSNAMLHTAAQSKQYVRK